MKKFFVSPLVFLFLFLSPLFAQWQQINMPQPIVNDMLILSTGKILVATSEGIYISQNNGLNWDSTLLSFDVQLIKKDNIGNIFASTGHLFRSTDEGLSWFSVFDLIPNNITNFFINDSNYIYLVEDYPSSIKAHKSTDFGLSWELIYSWFMALTTYNQGYSIIENSLGTIFISYYISSNSPPNLHYPQVDKKEVGTDWQLLFRGNKVVSNMYYLNDTMYITTITNYPQTGKGIFKSYDNGTIFIAINSGLNNLNVTQLILKPEIFLALTGDGVYKSLDNGNSWIRLDHTGLNAAINKLYYDENKNLYACTQNGIYLFNGELTTLNEDGVSLTPTEYSLSQNYPNHLIRAQR